MNGMSHSTVCRLLLLLLLLLLMGWIWNNGFVVFSRRQWQHFRFAKACRRRCGPTKSLFVARFRILACSLIHAGIQSRFIDHVCCLFCMQKDYESMRTRISCVSVWTQVTTRVTKILDLWSSPTFWLRRTFSDAVCSSKFEFEIVDCYKSQVLRGEDRTGRFTLLLS